MLNRRKAGFWFSVILLLGSVIRAEALVQVEPSLVELDDRNRTASIKVTNAGSVSENFRVYLSFSDMDETGELVEKRPGDEDPSAIDFIRFMPRSMSLDPGEHQLVRLRARMPEGLEEGEYRAHIYFQNVPEAPEISESEEEDGFSTTISFSTRVGVPIMITRGSPPFTAGIDDISLSPGREPKVIFNISADKRTLRGVVAAALVCPESGETVKASAEDFLVVYSGARVRHTLALDELDEGLEVYRGWDLRITYNRYDRDEEGVGGLLAEEYIKVK